MLGRREDEDKDMGVQNSIWCFWTIEKDMEIVLERKAGVTCYGDYPCKSVHGFFCLGNGGGIAGL